MKTQTFLLFLKPWNKYNNEAAIKTKTLVPSKNMSTILGHRRQFACALSCNKNATHTTQLLVSKIEGGFKLNPHSY